MKEPDFDLDHFRCALRGEVLRAVKAAFGTLSRACRRGGAIADDRQLRACLALARLAPSLLGAPPAPVPPLKLYGTPEEIEASIAILEGRACDWPRIEFSAQEDRDER